MPTVIFLTIAFQIQNIRWRYLFLVLASINLIANIYNDAWVRDLYSTVIVMMLFLITPCFSSWWGSRNARSNPDSFWQLAKETCLVAKHNKFKLIFWILFLIGTIYAAYWYVEYTGGLLLGWLLSFFLILFVLNNVLNLILPPEWFLHDINTRYVYVSLFIAWLVSYLIFQKLGIYFIVPMLFTVVFTLIGLYRVRHDAIRFLIPGCAVILADIAWQVIRFARSETGNTLGFTITVCILTVAIVIGLIWLLKRPGIFPIIYLMLFQLFRFSGFLYQGMNRLATNELTMHEFGLYILYLVCWMYLVPLVFWFVGLMQLSPMGDRRARPRSVHFSQKLPGS